MPISVAVCGERASHALELAANLRSALALSGHTDAAEVVVTAMETAPATLLTDVTVLLLCLSPCHPWTAARVVDRWIPLFSHLNALHILVVATRCELLLSRTVRHALSQHGTYAVEMEDVLAMVSDLEMTTAAAEVAFTAVSLQIPLQDVVGSSTISGTVASTTAAHRHHTFSPSVWNLCRLLVKCARCAALSVASSAASGSSSGCTDAPLRWLPTTETSVGWWQQLVDQLHVEAELRSLLPEWIEVHLADHVAAAADTSCDDRSSTGLLARRHAAVAVYETDRVYVSRRTQEVVDVRPAQLVLNDMSQLQPSFADQQRILQQNRAELYQTRKATAEADRKRAVDRSARRSAVADPVLLKREKRSALQQQVSLLERRHERLVARKAENVTTRALLEEVRAQVAQAREFTRGEPEDVAHHAAALTQAQATVVLVEADAREAARIAEEVEDSGLPAEVKRATAAYLAAWGVCKQLRVERDAAAKKLADVEEAVAQQEARLAVMDAKFEDLCCRCSAHAEETNRLQDEVLRLQSVLLRLEGVSQPSARGSRQAPPDDTVVRGETSVRSRQSVGHSLSSDQWLCAYLLPEETMSPGADVAGALAHLAEAKGEFVDRVLVPWSLCCDCESGGLMIEALAHAVHLARRAPLPSDLLETPSSRHAALFDFESAVRGSVVTEEMHVRLSGLLLEAHIVGLLALSDRMLHNIVEKVKIVASS